MNKLIEIRNYKSLLMLIVGVKSVLEILFTD